jgi:hypothetical protein
MRPPSQKFRYKADLLRSAKIVAETLDSKTAKWKALATFDTFDGFYDYALAFKNTDAEALLRVFIPGGFPLTADELKKIDNLGITRVSN